MKTLILCGGMGTRLKEETEYKPKPMVTIGGLPILVHIMHIYAHYGHKDFVLCLGYKGEVIKEYFLRLSDYIKDFEYNFKDGTVRHLSNHNHLDYKITFVNTGEETLSGERILIAGSLYAPDEPFMVTYGDGVANINIQSLLSFHQQKKRGRIGTITGVHPVSKYGQLEFTNSGKLTEFKEKPHMKTYINGGFMVFEPGALRYIQEGEMLEDSLKRMTTAGKLNVFLHEDFWHSMDTHKDFQELNKMWKDNPPWKVWS